MVSTLSARKEKEKSSGIQSSCEKSILCNDEEADEGESFNQAVRNR